MDWAVISKEDRDKILDEFRWSLDDIIDALIDARVKIEKLESEVEELKEE